MVDELAWKAMQGAETALVSFEADSEASKSNPEMKIECEKVIKKLSVSSEYLSSALIILAYLEQELGYWLGQAAARIPTKEQAEAHLDILLDEQQSKLFLKIRRLPQHKGSPLLESFLKRSCDRVRTRGQLEVESDPLKPA